MTECGEVLKRGKGRGRVARQGVGAGEPIHDPAVRRPKPLGLPGVAQEAGKSCAL